MRCRSKRNGLVGFLTTKQKTTTAEQIFKCDFNGKLLSNVLKVQARVRAVSVRKEGFPLFCASVNGVPAARVRAAGCAPLSVTFLNKHPHLAITSCRLTQSFIQIFTPLRCYKETQEALNYSASSRVTPAPRRDPGLRLKRGSRRINKKFLSQRSRLDVLAHCSPHYKSPMCVFKGTQQNYLGLKKSSLLKARAREDTFIRPGGICYYVSNPIIVQLTISALTLLAA